MTTNPQSDIDGLSDIGLVRLVNEDAFLIDTTAHVFAVADGMGGHGSGDVASNLALSEFQKKLQSDDVVARLGNSNSSDQECMDVINIIMRAMGLFDHVDIDIDVISLSTDITYLLCSDGLTAMIPDNTIAGIISQPHANARQTCENLNEKAKAAGGMDNISVITIKHYNGRKS